MVPDRRPIVEMILVVGDFSEIASQPVGDFSKVASLPGAENRPTVCRRLFQSRFARATSGELTDDLSPTRNPPVLPRPSPGGFSAR